MVFGLFFVLFFWTQQSRQSYSNSDNKKKDYAVSAITKPGIKVRKAWNFVWEEVFTLYWTKAGMV